MGPSILLLAFATRLLACGFGFGLDFGSIAGFGTFADAQPFADWGLWAQATPTASDPTAGGPADESGDESSGLMQIIFSGGIVGLLILLLLFALSITAAYLVFDQVMTLRRGEILPAGLAEAVRQALLTGHVQEADAACRRSPSVLGFVLHNGLSEMEFGWSQVEKAMEDALAEQASRLMRRIEYLSVIGNIAPMVGLLGTVTGMIFAFQEVAGSQGAAGAGDLAEGIYQALVTTVGGLIVAIPSLGAFAIFRNRVDGLIAEAAYESQHALGPIKRRPATRRPAPPPK
ncbi:MotA/TolQ/ExbB proton channel family protein [Candidatus Laterigemmans baculatus]|uniref:MotA/TolQ/ExbB proton channel family protein n=1 Tax=Candidatus Laterigemmans baculatus TaxID=2770505 RepID=UPI0013DA5E50|nr:MotA/TolQ/ExbB proton channel family protein [Candidatus Laterigemmans baculatus]